MKFTRWAPLAGVLIAGLVLATPANAGGGTSTSSDTSSSSSSDSSSEPVALSSDTSDTSVTESTDSPSSSETVVLTETSSSDTSSSESETLGSTTTEPSDSAPSETTSQSSADSTSTETTTASSLTCTDQVAGSYELDGPSGLARVEIDGTLPLCSPYPLTLVAWAYVTPGAHWNQVADHQDSVSITEPGEYFLSVGEGWCGQVDLYNATPITLGTVMTGPSVGYQQIWPWVLQPMTQAFWSAPVSCSVPESTSSETTTSETTTSTVSETPSSTPSESTSESSQTSITIDTSVTASPLPTTSAPVVTTSTFSPPASTAPSTTSQNVILVQQPGLILPNPGATGSTTGGSTVAATEPLAYTGFPTALLILGSAVLIALGLVFVATSRKRNARQH